LLALCLLLQFSSPMLICRSACAPYIGRGPQNLRVLFWGTFFSVVRPG
jgi:hypothetical protein